MKLTKKGRKEMSDSLFCGPNKTFPAHDAEHIHAGLKLLDNETFDISDEAKRKIKGALYRRGKLFNINPNDELLQKDPNILTTDDKFSEDEEKAIKSYFEKNDDADLPVEESNNKQNDDENVNNNFSFEDSLLKMKQDELVDTVKKLSKEKDNIVSTKDSEIKTLKEELEQKNIAIDAKEDTISKLLTDFYKVEGNYRNFLIDQILYLKKIDKESIEDEKKKFNNRKIDSLLDTINDTKAELDNGTVHDVTDSANQSIDNDDNEISRYFSV